MSNLAALLARLPRVGEATAARLAAAIAEQPEDWRRAVARAVMDERRPSRCPRCGDVPESDRCRCQDPGIPVSPILVVLTAEARRHVCRVWTGQCHVLGGLLPGAMAGIRALLERCRDPVIEDVVVALGQSSEARATEQAIADALRPARVTTWGLVHGAQWGHEIEDQDPGALVLALTERRPLR